MKKLSTGLPVLAAALALTLAPAASAHNRAHIILPSGVCMIVGSEKSVSLPNGTLLDLRPETQPADEFGTAFAADEGSRRCKKAPARSRVAGRAERREGSPLRPPPLDVGTPNGRVERHRGADRAGHRRLDLARADSGRRGREPSRLSFPRMRAG